MSRHAASSRPAAVLQQNTARAAAHRGVSGFRRLRSPRRVPRGSRAESGEHRAGPAGCGVGAGRAGHRNDLRSLHARGRDVDQAPGRRRGGVGGSVHGAGEGAGGRGQVAQHQGRERAGPEGRLQGRGGMRSGGDRALQPRTGRTDHLPDPWDGLLLPGAGRKRSQKAVQDGPEVEGGILPGLPPPRAPSLEAARHLDRAWRVARHAPGGAAR